MAEILRIRREIRYEVKELTLDGRTRPSFSTDTPEGYTSGEGKIYGLSPTMTWMVEINGILMDVRQVNRSIQEEALRLGLIPYLPKVSD